MLRACGSWFRGRIGRDRRIAQCLTEFLRDFIGDVEVGDGAGKSLGPKMRTSGRNQWMAVPAARASVEGVRTAMRTRRAPSFALSRARWAAFGAEHRCTRAYAVVGLARSLRRRRVLDPNRRRSARWRCERRPLRFLRVARQTKSRPLAHATGALVFSKARRTACADVQRLRWRGFGAPYAARAARGKAAESAVGARGTKAAGPVGFSGLQRKVFE